MIGYVFRHSSVEHGFSQEIASEELEVLDVDLEVEFREVRGHLLEIVLR
jgi:hypothetical protein